MSRRRAAPSALAFPFLLARRYLKSTRRDAFVSFLSAVAAGGLALGVAALILALAALSGFQSVLKAEILARTPGIEVILPAGADPEDVRGRVAALPGVREAQLLRHGQGWLVGQGQVRAVEIVAYAGAVPESFPGAAGGPPGLYVGDLLARAWGLSVGDALEVASTRATLTPLGPQPRVIRLPLAGTFQTGRTEQEERIAVPWEGAGRLLGPGEVRLAVAAGGLEAALAMAPRVRAAVPAGSEVRTWRDLNRPLFFALSLEKSVMFVAVFLVVLVAALALVSDVALIVAAKRPEIGMLGAMGAAPAELGRAFLLLGGMLAGFGVAGGGGAGIAGAWLLDRYRLFRLPEQVYFLDYVPFLVRWTDLAVVFGLTLALTLACAGWAARRAAALDPVAALRR